MEIIRHYLKVLIKPVLAPFNLAKVTLIEKPIFHDLFSVRKISYLADLKNKPDEKPTDEDDDPPPPPSSATGS